MQTTPQISEKQLLATFHQMIPVEGGEFIMGSDDPEDSFVATASPPHRVQLSDFHIGKYPVTQALWELVMDGENPSRFRGKQRPVERVSWDETTKEFLPRLNKATGLNYRLPTEAEWEYAAKGGKHQQWFIYSGSDELDTVGWFGEDNCGETMPVGMKAPNILGIYDMSGNVWEWCQDQFGEEYYQQCHDQGLVVDPKGPDSGHGRVFRGGCWHYSSRGCLVARRYYNSPRNIYYDSMGLRLAL